MFLQGISPHTLKKSQFCPLIHKYYVIFNISMFGVLKREFTAEFAQAAGFFPWETSSLNHLVMFMGLHPSRS